jgi:hypothetical protein
MFMTSRSNGDFFSVFYAFEAVAAAAGRCRLKRVETSIESILKLPYMMNRF